jgi:hypothetical protein
MLLALAASSSVAFVTIRDISHQDDAHAALLAFSDNKLHISHPREVIHPPKDTAGEMATATQRAEDADKSAGLGEVSLPQKMMSAVSGSILTSLLGVCLYFS